MRYIKLTATSIILFFYMCEINAIEVTRSNVQVQKIVPIATDRPASPAVQGTIRVYLNSGAWGSTSCRTDAADLQKVDSHLLGTLLSGISLRKTIDIVVESNLRPDGGEVCQAIAIILNM